MRIAISAAAFGAALTVALLSPSASFARPAFPPGAEPKQPGRVMAPKAAKLKTLVGTVMDSGNLATTVDAGYTLIDQNIVDCKTKTCTISIDMNEQVGNAAATGNWFAVCAVVDGSFATSGCPYAGEVPSDYSYVNARARQTFSVTKGDHAVAAYLYLSSASADSDGFDIEYGVWTP